MPHKFEIAFVAEIETILAKVQELGQKIGAMRTNFVVNVVDQHGNEMSNWFGGQNQRGQGNRPPMWASGVPNVVASPGSSSQGPQPGGMPTGQPFGGGSKDAQPGSAWQNFRQNDPSYQFLRAQHDEMEREKHISIVTKGKGAESFLSDRINDAKTGGAESKGTLLALEGLRHELEASTKAMASYRLLEEAAVDRGDILGAAAARAGSEGESRIRQGAVDQAAKLGGGEDEMWATLKRMMPAMSLAGAAYAYNIAKDVVASVVSLPGIAVGQQGVMMAPTTAAQTGLRTGDIGSLMTTLDPRSQAQARDIGNNAWWANEKNVGLFRAVGETLSGGSPMGVQATEAEMRAYQAQQARFAPLIEAANVAVERSSAMIPFQRQFGMNYSDSLGQGFGGGQYGVSAPEMANATGAFGRFGGGSKGMLGGSNGEIIRRLIASGIDPNTAATIAGQLYRGSGAGALGGTEDLINQALGAGAGSTDLATHYASQVAEFGSKQGILGAPADTSFMQSAIAWSGMSESGLATAQAGVGAIQGQTSQRSGIMGLGNAITAQRIVDQFAPGLDPRRKWTLIGILSKYPEAQWPQIIAKIGPEYGISPGQGKAMMRGGNLGATQFRRQLFGGFGSTESQELLFGEGNAAENLAAAGIMGHISAGGEYQVPGGAGVGTQARAEHITDDTSVAFAKLKNLEVVMATLASKGIDPATQSIKNFSDGLQVMKDKLDALMKEKYPSTGGPPPAVPKKTQKAGEMGHY